VAQAAALGALSDQEHVRHSVRVNRDGLRQLENGLEQLGLTWIPSVANFICVHLGRPGAEVYEQLLHHGVIVRPVAGYNLPDHLRVTVGTEQENQRVIDALGQVLAG
jgi:histidinol-phosphate aminotransferase